MTRSTEWLRHFHPAPQASTQLVCLPHAGGSASYYFPVSRRLAPAVDVLAVQYPGRQERYREACVPTVDELADRVTAELIAVLDRPFALFGHSMGAALAFEVAARLERTGRYPTGVFVSGRRAPSVWRRETTHQLPDDGLLADVRGLAGTDAGVFGDDELISMVLPAIRNDYTAIETYLWTGGAPLEAPIHALCGTHDPKATLEDVASWRDHTRAEFTFTSFPGGHFFLNEHAGAVIDILALHLAEHATRQEVPAA